MAIPRTRGYELRLALVLLAAGTCWSIFESVQFDLVSLFVSEDEGRMHLYEAYQKLEMLLGPVSALASGAGLLATWWLIRWPRPPDALKWGVICLFVLRIVMHAVHGLASVIAEQFSSPEGHRTVYVALALLASIPSYALRILVGFRCLEIAKASTDTRAQQPALISFIASCVAIALYLGAFLLPRGEEASRLPHYLLLGVEALTGGLFVWSAVAIRRALATEAPEDDEAAAWFSATRGLSLYEDAMGWMLRIVMVVVPMTLFGVVVGSPGILSFTMIVGGLAFGIVGVFVMVSLTRMADIAVSGRVKGLFAAAAACALAGPYSAVGLVPFWAEQLQDRWSRPAPPVGLMLGSELLAVAGALVVIVALGKWARTVGAEDLGQRFGTLLVVWIAGVVGIVLFAVLAVLLRLPEPLLFLVGAGAILGSIWFVVHYLRLVSQLRERVPDEGMPAAAVA